MKNNCICGNCEIVKTAFAGAASEPHLNYLPVHALLSTMLKQNRLEVYAGDCPFDEMTEQLNNETHYTVCFYLKCIKCGKVFFFGACVRGVPIYKAVDDTTRINFNNQLWGREGTYFEQLPPRSL